jgi:hypothetical protein
MANLISEVIHLEKVRLFASAGLLVVLGDLGFVLHVNLQTKLLFSRIRVVLA